MKKLIIITLILSAIIAIFLAYNFHSSIPLLVFFLLTITVIVFQTKIEQNK